MRKFVGVFFFWGVHKYDYIYNYRMRKDQKNAKVKRDVEKVTLRYWIVCTNYTYMHVHEKYACGTETQLPASRKQ